jgi:hypothetical protein
MGAVLHGIDGKGARGRVGGSSPSFIGARLNGMEQRGGAHPQFVVAMLYRLEEEGGHHVCCYKRETSLEAPDLCNEAWGRMVRICDFVLLLGIVFGGEVGDHKQRWR